MKVLVLTDISGATKANPFTVELIKSLSAQNQVESVEHGLFWLTSIRADWDLVVIQWPELLLREDAPGAIAGLTEWLRRVAKAAAIISIVHNLGAHYRNDIRSQALYALVNSVTDGFVHLGAASVDLYRQAYPDAAHIPVLIVPHGDYTCFGEPLTVPDARRKIGILGKCPVALVLGELRANEEFDLALECAKSMRARGGHLLLAGRVPVVTRGSRTGRLKMYATWGLRAAYFFIRAAAARGVILHEREIPARLMAAYVSAADILIIPRVKALNSGNVALGFSFGKIVVGPDEGNIGWVLRENGNPVFSLSEPGSVKAAVEQGLDLAARGVGDRNRIVATTQWRWSAVARDIVRFGRQLGATADMAESSEA